MHLITIENEVLKLSIAETGAEIRSLVSKPNQTEWMWQADPRFWPRTAPVLFPIVGKLVEDQYFYKGHPYPLSQHGFARDRVFTMVNQGQGEIRFQLVSDYESLKFYPFDFQLTLGYFLEGNKVWVDFEVFNSGQSNLYFSIGGHPGFALPQWPDKKYYLEFEADSILQPRLLQSGLLKQDQAELIHLSDKELEISSTLFEKDALVLHNLKSKWVGFRSEDNSHNLRLHFDGFPDFGIWAKPGAPFVCLEPWFGYADSVGSSGEISEKPGIIGLKPEQKFQCRYAIEILNHGN
jgi:galactose mutarotase-like enzyme